VIWLCEDEIAPLAAIEGLLNAAAAGDIPVAEENACVLALDALSAELGVLDRAAAAVYADHPAAPAPKDGASQELCAKVVDYLRRRCAMVPLPRLAGDLDATVERIHCAVETLHREGTVAVVHDRSHTPVVFLSPAALVELPGDLTAISRVAPPHSGVLRVQVGGHVMTSRRIRPGYGI